MRAAPGSFAWLVAHDLRLSWRRFAGMRGAASPWAVAALACVGLVLMHLAGVAVAHWLSPRVHGVDGARAPLAAFLFCLFTWMIAQSLFGATRTLYDRGDLDLLLGSPIAPSRVFAAKAMSIGAGTFASIALLMLPVANAGAIVDRLDWLAVYPVLMGLTLIATAIAVALSIGLFFLFGPRRARVYAQLFGAGIGGAFVLGVQIVAVLPAAKRDAVGRWFEGMQQAGALHRSMLSLPVEALRGDIAAMVALVGLGGLLFGLAVALLGDRFAQASLAAAGDGGAGEPDAGRATGFKTGLATSLRRKEWSTMLRDPSLFAQLGLQIVYTIPLAVVLLRNGSLPTALALAPTLVVVAGQVAASLAWITVSGEDAPELIATAPVSPAAVDRAKLSAVALPVLLIVALPLLGLALASFRAAAMAVIFIAGAAVSTALLNLWHPMPGNRRGLLRRHSQSKIIGLVEHLLAVLWAVAVVLAMLGSLLFLLPIIAAVGIVALARQRIRVADPVAPQPAVALAPARC